MSILQDIRSLATKLTKEVDDFVAEAERDIQEKENVLDKKIKQYAVLKEKEKQLRHIEEGIKKERTLLEKEKSDLGDKQRLLKIKEDKLNEKIRKVNEVLSL